MMDPDTLARSLLEEIKDDLTNEFPFLKNQPPHFHALTSYFNIIRGTWKTYRQEHYLNQITVDHTSDLCKYVWDAAVYTSLIYVKGKTQLLLSGA